MSIVKHLEKKRELKVEIEESQDNTNKSLKIFCQKSINQHPNLFYVYPSSDYRVAFSEHHCE